MNHYECAFKEMDLNNNKAAIFQPVLHLLRRVFVVVILFYCNNWTVFLQLSLLVIAQVGIMCYIVGVRCFESKEVHRIHLVNETTIILTIYYAYLWTDLVPLATVRYFIAWILIAILAINAVFNV